MEGGGMKVIKMGGGLRCSLRVSTNFTTLCGFVCIHLGVRDDIVTKE